MKVEIKNGKLLNSINFMHALKLARKHSRFSRRFIELMQARFDVVEKDRIELLKEHSRKDENGDPIIIDGRYDVKDTKAFNTDLDELHEEKLIIEGGDNREMIRIVRRILKKLIDDEVEYEGVTSETFDYLCDQFNADEEEGDEE